MTRRPAVTLMEVLIAMFIIGMLALLALFPVACKHGPGAQGRPLGYHRQHGRTCRRQHECSLRFECY